MAVAGREPHAPTSHLTAELQANKDPRNSVAKSTESGMGLSLNTLRIFSTSTSHTLLSPVAGQEYPGPRPSIA
jgi:hypothetical protein